MCFAIWNNLPDFVIFVKVADLFNVFKRRLKCHLFARPCNQPSFQLASRLATSQAANYGALNLVCT